ncbi:MAG: DUF302 domain-containing protein [Candidatus Dormibacteria bacterium]
MYATAILRHETFEDVIERVKTTLASHGFGVLSDIDVAATLRMKIGKEILPYRILGACNPSFAFRGIEMEPTLGVLLPCNVVIREVSDGVEIDIQDPTSIVRETGNDQLAILADEVQLALNAVADELHQ